MTERCPRLPLIAIVGLTFVFGTVGCGERPGGTAGTGGGTTPSGSGRVKSVFTFVNRGEVGTLDPNDMSWMQDIRIAYCLWEGIYRLNPQTIEPEPGAAERVEVSDDGLVYTATLRDNARWSNGDPLTSGDFVFAWRRMLESPGDYTYLLHYIRGAEAYENAFSADSSSADWSSVGIEAPDPRTLRVTLTSPTPFFPDLLAFPPFFPLHERSMAPFRRTGENHRVRYDAGYFQPPHLVGNGPYRITSWRVKVGQTLERNEHYWDAASTRTPRIEALSIDNPLLAFQRYEAGQIDWLAEVDAKIAVSMRSQNRPDLHVFPSNGTYFYTFNCRPTRRDGRANPFADARVRRAFTMAVDKRPIVERITRLGEPVTSGYVPRIFQGYPHPDGLGHDVEVARRLLAEAGYPGGRGFPQVRLLYNSELDLHRDVGQYVRRQWAEVLGVNVDLDGIEIKQFQPRLQNGDFDVARASWFGDYEDVSTFTDKYRSNSINNDADWENAEYDALVRQAVTEQDPAARLSLLARAEGILLNDAPILPLFHYVNKYAHRANVKGLVPNDRMMFMLQAVEVLE